MHVHGMFIFEMYMYGEVRVVWGQETGVGDGFVKGDVLYFQGTEK